MAADEHRRTWTGGDGGGGVPFGRLLGFYVLVSVLPGLVFSPCRAAGDAPARPPSVERLVIQLGDPDWATRENATYALLENEGVDDALLTAAFRSARSAEQVHRLTRIAIHRFYRQRDRAPAGAALGDADNAGLGVDLRPPRVVFPYQNPRLPNPALFVGGTMPGFPAFAQLRPGDLITGIGDKPFGEDLSPDRFIEIVKVCPPFSRLVFHVIRDGRAIDVSFTADSKLRLVRVYGEQPRNAAWGAAQQPFQDYLAKLTGGASAGPRVVIELPTEDKPRTDAPAVSGS